MKDERLVWVTRDLAYQEKNTVAWAQRRRRTKRHDVLYRLGYKKGIRRGHGNLSGKVSIQ